MNKKTSARGRNLLARQREAFDQCETSALACEKLLTTVENILLGSEELSTNA
jgi:hypothetical protein